MLVPTILILYSHWQWPAIQGLHSFQGTLLHSASWSPNADLKDQRVAVIGNGSSGIQLVTALQPGESICGVMLIRGRTSNNGTVVKHLTTFIRSPTWISTTLGQEFAGANGANFECK
jgi:FlaA1/EpsC-like NDP-sugar epimerase